MPSVSCPQYWSRAFRTRFRSDSLTSVKVTRRNSRPAFRPLGFPILRNPCRSTRKHLFHRSTPALVRVVKLESTESDQQVNHALLHPGQTHDLNSGKTSAHSFIRPFSKDALKARMEPTGSIADFNCRMNSGRGSFRPSARNFRCSGLAPAFWTIWRKIETGFAGMAGFHRSRNGRAESLKIQEMKWVFQPCQKGFNLLPFDVRLAGNRRRPLNFVSGGLKTR